MMPDAETFHMGGDEVFFPCWNSTDEIVDLLKTRGLGRDNTAFLQLWAEFQSAALRLWDDENGRTPSSRNEVSAPSKVILWSSHLTNSDTIEKYLQNDRYKKS